MGCDAGQTDAASPFVLSRNLGLVWIGMSMAVDDDGRKEKLATLEIGSTDQSGLDLGFPASEVPGTQDSKTHGA